LSGILERGPVAGGSVMRDTAHTRKPLRV
jgi:hypothetical protein